MISVSGEWVLGSVAYNNPPCLHIHVKISTTCCCFPLDFNSVTQIPTALALPTRSSFPNITKIHPCALSFWVVQHRPSTFTHISNSSIVPTTNIMNYSSSILQLAVLAVLALAVSPKSIASSSNIGWGKFHLKWWLYIWYYTIGAPRLARWLESWSITVWQHRHIVCRSTWPVGSSDPLLVLRMRFQFAVMLELCAVCNRIGSQFSPLCLFLLCNRLTLSYCIEKNKILRFKTCVQTHTHICIL